MDKHDRDEVFKWTMTKLRMAVDGVVAPPPIDLNLGNAVQEAKKEENNPSNDEYKLQKDDKITETVDVDLGLGTDNNTENSAQQTPETTLIFRLSPEEQAEMTNDMRSSLKEDISLVYSKSKIRGMNIEIETDEAGLRDAFGDLDLEGDEEISDSIEDVAKSQDENCK
jgi:hypothetical protein